VKRVLGKLPIWALLVLWCLTGCGATQNVDTGAVLGYGQGLASCEAQEALFDGGPEASLQFYVDCKHKLGVDAGGL
jgi:hypothetical protein